MKLGCSVLGAALAAAMLAFAPATHAQPTNLRLHGALLPSDPSTKAMAIFKTEAERLSGGTLEIEVAPTSPLVDVTRDLVDELRTQSTFGIWIGASYLSRLVPEIGVLGLPFVFDNFDQMVRAINGPAGSLIEAKLAAKGFTTLGWMDWGARNVVNAKRPLRTPDDFKGLKLRSLPNETHLAVFRAMGANPVGMDIKDALLALRQGDLEGMETSYVGIDDLKLYDYGNRYLSNSAHIHDVIMLVANKKALTSLQPREQRAIREAAVTACAQQRKIWAARDAEAFEKLKEKGMQFDSLPPETRAALRQATAVVVDDVRKRLGNKLVDEVLAATRGGGKSNHTRL